MRIKEAITNPFVVIEDRLKPIQKHYPPCLEDDVWRLEGIFKNGKYHQRLKDRGIFKVQDFLKSLQKNRNGLRDEILKMPPSKWEVTLKHAETCIPIGEMAPFCNQQIKPGWETSQPTEQSIQTVYEQRKVDFSSNVQIRIQNDGSLNHQQFGGSSFLQHDITSQPLAGCSHMFVNGTSKSEETLKHFSLDASTCPGEKSPAVDMSSLHNKLQENDCYGFQPICCANPEPEFSWDDFSLSSPEYLGSDPAGFADGCFNMPAESTTGKLKGNSKWSMLRMAMVFTVRIVAVKGMNVENPHEA